MSKTTFFCYQPPPPGYHAPERLVWPPDSAEKVMTQDVKTVRIIGIGVEPESRRRYVELVDAATGRKMLADPAFAEAARRLYPAEKRWQAIMRAVAYSERRDRRAERRKREGW